MVGSLLDRFGPRPVFMGAAAIQVVFFALMPGLSDWAALFVALAFMLGAFGQIPINDYMIGKMAKTELRASVYGARFVVTAAVFAATHPLHRVDSPELGLRRPVPGAGGSRALTLAAVTLLPRRLPDPHEPTLRWPRSARWRRHRLKKK